MDRGGEVWAAEEMTTTGVYSPLMRCLWLALLLLLAGCGSSPQTGPTPVPVPSPSPAPEPTPAPTPAPIAVTVTLTNTVTGAVIGSSIHSVNALPAQPTLAQAGYVARQAGGSGTER